MSPTALVADVVPSSLVDGPGNRFVVFLQGCTFNCLACHNPQTIAQRVPGRGAGADTGSEALIDSSVDVPSDGPVTMHVDEVLDRIREAAPFLSGVTVSGGEATCQWEFVDELFRRLAHDPATAGLSRLIDTNGDADHEVWATLATSMDGAMVDLKALDPEVHRLLTGRENARVLAAIVELSSLDRLAEVRLLLIPGVNDTPSQLEATAAFLSALDPVPPVVLLGFRHEGTRPIARRFTEATTQHLERAAALLAEAGLDTVTIRRPH